MFLWVTWKWPPCVHQRMVLFSMESFYHLVVASATQRDFDLHNVASLHVHGNRGSLADMCDREKSITLKLGSQC